MRVRRCLTVGLGQAAMVAGASPSLCFVAAAAIFAATAATTAAAAAAAAAAAVG